MFIPFLVGAVLAASLLTGGSLKGLAQAKIRGSALFFLPLLLQIALFRWGGDRAAIGHMGTYVLLLAAVFFNLHLPGIKVMMLGLTANFLVIACNGGYMPMSLDALRGAGLEGVADYLQGGGMLHNGIAMSEGTRLWFLGDIFYLPPPFPFPNVLSLGDLLLVIGGGILCWRLTRASKDRDDWRNCAAR
ncbi:MAG: DUF5317 domain-containing protein [Limnochordia bacterium]|nr:DUF5317 domain-containing protein [Bacillota bacterium]